MKFNFFSDFEQKNGTWRKNFQQGCQSYILRVQGNILSDNFFSEIAQAASIGRSPEKKSA